MDPDDILDTSRLCFEGSFDAQVQNILQRVRLTRSEVQDLRLLVRDLEEALQQLAPGCQVTPFGSIVTGLGIRTSDVDCFVGLPRGVAPTKQCVTRARNILQQNRALFTNLFAITAAKVPIVKFQHVPTGCDCDVSFKSPSGVRNSELIACLLQMDERALPMAILVKYWSKVYNFTGTNLMPNYALSLLVVFYLQTRNVLPSVTALQNNVEPIFIDNWNTGFNNNIRYGTDNTESLYDLLGGFFKYYSCFNFVLNVISPYLGRVVGKKQLERLDHAPREFELYKRNVSNGACKELRLDTLMCVQDPFDHSRNCTVAMYPRLMEKVMAHFRFAATMFDQVNADRFLRETLTADPTPTQDRVDQPPGRQKRVLHNNIKKHIPDHGRGIRKRPRPGNRNHPFKLQNNVNNMYVQYHRMVKGKR